VAIEKIRQIQGKANDFLNIVVDEQIRNCLLSLRGQQVNNI